MSRFHRVRCGPTDCFLAGISFVLAISATLPFSQNTLAREPDVTPGLCAALIEARSTERRLCSRRGASREHFLGTGKPPACGVSRWINTPVK